MIRLFLLLATLTVCECVYVYSSFWAPLFNPKILNYRVDLTIDPDAGKIARAEYASKYGYRGQKLIEDFGNGKGPTESLEKVNNEVKFYYTYPGADNIQKQ